MRRKAPGLRVLHLLWAACLCAPPAARMWLDFSGTPRRELGPGPEAARVAAVEARLREAEHDLKALDVTLPGQEFKPVLARVLSRDTAPGRGAFLVGVRCEEAVGADIAAITEDHQLLGRVLDVITPPAGIGGFSVAQVQTLLDKGFRVPVLIGETRGLAAGTGVTTDDGHPLLKILFLDGPRELREGELVRTDGSSGVFAPGIPVGSISWESRALDGREGDRNPLIRSEVVIERRGRSAPRRVVLLQDSLRLSAARVAERSER